MEVTKVVVCSLALAACWWGTVRVGRRLMADSPDLEERRHAVDLCAVGALVGSLAVLVHARWWFDGSDGWPRRLVILLHLSWLGVALWSAVVALVRLESVLTSRSVRESPRMATERNVATAVLALAFVGVVVAVGVIYETPHTPEDEGYVSALLLEADLAERLNTLDLSGDPELHAAVRQLQPTPHVVAEARRLADRWHLTEESSSGLYRDVVDDVVKAYPAAAAADPAAANRTLRDLVAILARSGVSCGLAEFFLSSGVARLADADEERCYHASELADLLIDRSG